MTTAAVGIERVLAMLQSGNREQVNLLATTLSDTTTTSVVMSDTLRGIQEGAAIGIETELMYVRSVDEPSKTATVIRGYAGSTAATHTSGVQVVVNPKFPRASIFDAMNDSLDALSAEGLYQMATVDLTSVSSTIAYDLTSVTDVSNVHAVRFRTRGSSKEWIHLPSKDWHLQRNASTSDFASGFALVVDAPIPSGVTMRVEYKAPFVRAATAASDLNTFCKLPSTANDLLYVTTAIALVYPREVKRNFMEAQGDTRRAEEVPAGANLGAARGWEAVRQRRLRDEIRRLQRKYPTVRY